MIKVSSIYEHISKDVVSAPENGRFSISSFNRHSKTAELDLLNWLTGDVEGLQLPAPFTTQKDKDWLAPFILPVFSVVKNGRYRFPDDYYQFENLYYIIGELKDCDDEEIRRIRKPIELLDGSQFAHRADTWVEELKPVNKPISKVLSEKDGTRYFYFEPEDIGNVQLEYIRYPKFASAASKIDPTYKEEVIDELNSVDYEWGEWARPYLITLISSSFARKNRERSLQEQNEVVKKSRP